MVTQSSAERREDAHRKILLGGLVVKAGLDKADRAYILGVLLTAADLYNDPPYREAMVARGRDAFDQ